ncbi:MAG: helix-turn-helix domain-containing protein [Phycisphaeraceae bacterium]
MLPAQPNRSLIDGMAILQAIAAVGGDVGVRELGRQLELESTRVHRLLRTFVHLGLVERTAEGRYRPGPGIHVLAAQSLFGSGLIRRAMLVLEQLSVHNRMVAMGVLWRDQTSYLYHAEPGMSPTDALGRVGLYPATRSSIGLVLLAERPADELANLYADRDTPGFPGGLPSLKQALATIRRDGYALVDEAPPTARRTLAVPVGRPAYAAVALAGRITKPQLSALLAALRDAAQVIDAGANPSSLSHTESSP